MSHPTSASAGILENGLRHRWVRLCEAGSILTVILFAGALGYLVRFEPRLLAVAEILPPDESLVAALLPPFVAFAIVGVLYHRLRRVPARVFVGPDGIAWDPSRVGTTREVSWPNLSIPTSSGSWEGDRLDLLRTGRPPAHLWVDRDLADELRLRKGPRGASAGLARPQR